VSAAPALAQTQSAERFFVNLSGGVQVGSADVTSVQPFELYGESGSLTSAQDVKGGLFFDGHLGYRLRPRIAVGVGVSFINGKADADVTASVPDPIVFDSPRLAGATASDLTHRETWVSGLVTYTLPLTSKIDVMVSGGPAMVAVQQEIPTAATVTEPGPVVGGITATTYKKSGIGFVVGADIRYMVTSRIGLGAVAKFAAGSVDVTEGTKVDAGGFQLGGGLRIKF
jgi:hypothetical protein